MPTNARIENAIAKELIPTEMLLSDSVKSLTVIG